MNAWVVLFGILGFVASLHSPGPIVGVILDVPGYIRGWPFPLLDSSIRLSASWYNISSRGNCRLEMDLCDHGIFALMDWLWFGSMFLRRKENLWKNWKKSW